MYTLWYTVPAEIPTDSQSSKAATLELRSVILTVVTQGSRTGKNYQTPETRENALTYIHTSLGDQLQKKTYLSL